MKVTITKQGKSNDYDFDFASETFQGTFFGKLVSDLTFPEIAERFNGAETIVLHNDFGEDETITGYNTFQNLHKESNEYTIQLVKG